MEKINDLFDVEVTKTFDAFPSVFSKDDVVKLLSELRGNILATIEDIQPAVLIAKEKFQDFASSVTAELSRRVCNGNFEVVDYDSAEFTIDYGNKISLENIGLNEDNIEEELHDILLSEFQKHFNDKLEN
jgi:hypothetical protein